MPRITACSCARLRRARTRFVLRSPPPLGLAHSYFGLVRIFPIAFAGGGLILDVMNNKTTFMLLLALALIAPTFDTSAQVRKGNKVGISTLRIGADKMSREECIAMARSNSFNKDLQGAKLDGADLSNVNLLSANLNQANLKKAILTDAIMIRADLSNANMDGAILRGADLNGAALYNANLKNACLAEAVLANAYLVGADLTKADFTNADLTGADLTGAELKDAVFTGARLEQAILPAGFKLPEEKQPEDGKAKQ